MIRAYYLYTGKDGNSHVIRGSIIDKETIGVESILFKESPPHSSLHWHTAPTTQYVITLSGILEFVTRDGETFKINPGEILVAEDTAGSGHKWHLTNDQPWKRAYVAFKKNTKVNFQADEGQHQPV
jgi:quercetin dioxygenase-like cupin family protein